MQKNNSLISSFLSRTSVKANELDAIKSDFQSLTNFFRKNYFIEITLIAFLQNQLKTLWNSYKGNKAGRTEDLKSEDLYTFLFSVLGIEKRQIQYYAKLFKVIQVNAKNWKQIYIDRACNDLKQYLKNFDTKGVLLPEIETETIVLTFADFTKEVEKNIETELAEFIFLQTSKANKKSESLKEQEIANNKLIKALAEYEKGLSAKDKKSLKALKEDKKEAKETEQPLELKEALKVAQS